MGRIRMAAVGVALLSGMLLGLLWMKPPRRGPGNGPTAVVAPETRGKRERVRVPVTLRRDVPARGRRRTDNNGGRPVEAPTSPRREPEAQPGDMLLRFSDDAGLARFLALARSQGLDAQVHDAFGFLLRVRGDAGAIGALVAEARRAGAECSPNYAVRVPPQPPAAPGALQPVGPGFGGGVLRWLGIGGERTGWGKGVKVAVLDSGVNDHAALREVRIERVDLVGGQGLDTSTSSAHGTAVAALIAGGAAGVEGLAPGASLLSVRIVDAGGRGDALTLARGILEAVRRGAGIINLSLSSGGDSFVVREAVEKALAAGVVIVAAAGNDGTERVSFPAAYPGVLAVSAVNAAAGHASFANRGDWIDLAAPGVDILTAGPGSDVTATFSGTSASAPLVSGAIAALVSLEPGLDPAGAARLLSEYADDVGAPGRDAQVGDGILNPVRAMERDIEGIYDMAVRPPFLRESPDGTGEVVCFAQNVGTETVPGVRLRIVVDGGPYSVFSRNVGVGGIVSHTCLVSLAEVRRKGEVRVNMAVECEPPWDRQPANDSMAASLVYRHGTE